jgi:hypothetical protein
MRVCGCHMRRYEEEATCVCVSNEEEDTCVSYEEARREGNEGVCVCHMRRRIHVCHMRRRIHVWLMRKRGGEGMSVGLLRKVRGSSFRVEFRVSGLGFRV